MIKSLNDLSPSELLTMKTNWFKKIGWFYIPKSIKR
jgi:hypothetical protein